MDLSFYLQIPYKYNGRNINGIDCWGLVLLFYKREFGIDIIDYKHNTDSYSELNDFIEIIAINNEQFTRVDDLKFGDLLLIKNQSETINHIGIYLGDNKFIHAIDKIGVAISKIHIWRPKIAMFMRHKELLC